ncbi:glycosyltransferase [Lichenicoccus sp.]|uniref:glycosyltransferase n=1 Tax=Lichenicoccus sp. TaxID=2781899 RepID=UPI003D0A0B3D
MTEVGQPLPDRDEDVLLDSYRNSLRLQQMRIAALQTALEERQLRVSGLERSTSWRLTMPLRLAGGLAAGRLPNGMPITAAARRVHDIVTHDGIAALARRIVGRPLHPARKPAIVPMPPAASAIPAMMRRSALIVAELSVPQCAKYRVWQKCSHLQRLGWPCLVVDWHATQDAMSALSCATEVIFYRVPATPEVLGLIRAARRLGLQPFWEVDDLIFDEPLYRRNTNLARLEPALREELLAGVRLYRRAMLECNRAIASTPVLAQAMREAGVAEVHCIENALDDETIATACALRARKRPASCPMIVYGSGTRTHDADFLLVAAALGRLLARHPDLRLRIVGELTLPESLRRFGSRIEDLPGTDYRAYLGLLSESDIAIAPLEATRFNDAKSNIKFQEASILGLPCVCSPRAAFAGVIEHGRNGMLAETERDWEQALDALVRDPDLRRRIGEAALLDVSRRYAPEAVARTQVLPLFGAPDADLPARPARPLRVLMANVFLWPRSFGGATIVAEEMARRLHARDDTTLAIFTSHGDVADYPGALLRYDWDAIPVFATGLPPPDDHVASFDNPAAVAHFAAALDAVRPDIVHVHSIQGFGATILRLCLERGIPYVVTLHDAWFLCDRQFMVRGDGRYCFQTRIDLKICQACLPHARHLEARRAIMQQVLRDARHLLSPSASHRALFLANGVEPDRISVNRNGLRAPDRARLRRPRGCAPRFGFVGGNERIKGFHLVRQAFESLASGEWELILVDNTLNLGFSSIDVEDWDVRGRITIIPAYRQDGLDDFFDRLDVLLFPSQWKESYGLSVREALARDVWVIATAPGGQSEDVVDGINGRLIPLDARPHGLIAAIEEILAGADRLDDYANPHRDALADHASQARELHAVLARAARLEPGPMARSADILSRVNKT